jgi:PAS domain S-box-containing protein
MIRSQVVSIALSPHDDRNTELNGAISVIEEWIQLGYWQWDMLTSSIEWSAGLYDLLGFDPRTVKPSPGEINAITVTQDRRPAGEIERLLRSGLNPQRTYRIVRPDGRIRWVEARSTTYFDQAGKPLRAFGVMRDVTLEQTAREIFVEHEARFDAFVAAVHPLATWLMAPDGKCIGVIGRPSLTETSSAGELHGYKWQNLIFPDDLDLVMSIVRRSASQGEGFVHEHRLRRPDGGYRWARTRAIPIKGEDGALREFIGVTVDIHDEKTLSSGEDKQLTGVQIRAARAIANWSVQELSDASDLSPATIRRLEAYDGPAGLTDTQAEKLRNVLGNAGVRFIFHPDAKPAVAPK